MTTYSIYKIFNHINSKVYIGWTTNPKVRFREHKRGSGSLLQKAIRKYGLDNFTFDVIYQTFDLDHSREMEVEFISEHNALIPELGGWGYNIEVGGKSCPMSETTKDKIRIAHAKRVASGMYVNPRYGVTLSEETKLKISEANAGKVMSEETKRLMSERKRELNEIRKNNGEYHNPKSGVPRTQEVKDKIRKSLLGKKPSAETRKKLSEARKGKPRSEETKRKIKESWAKRKHNQ